MILEELEVYNLALQISDRAWEFYNYIPKEFRFSIGSQLLEASDSIGANIAEGFGRFHYKDSIKFYYNARGSLTETKHWNTLLNRRNLITNEMSERMKSITETEHLKLNNFINSIKTKVP